VQCILHARMCTRVTVSHQSDVGITVFAWVHSLKVSTRTQNQYEWSMASNSMMSTHLSEGVGDIACRDERVVQLLLRLQRVARANLG